MKSQKSHQTEVTKHLVQRMSSKISCYRVRIATTSIHLKQNITYLCKKWPPKLSFELITIKIPLTQNLRTQGAERVGRNSPPTDALSWTCQLRSAGHSEHTGHSTPYFVYAASQVPLGFSFEYEHDTVQKTETGTQTHPPIPRATDQATLMEQADQHLHQI